MINGPHLKSVLPWKDQFNPVCHFNRTYVITSWLIWVNLQYNVCPVYCLKFWECYVVTEKFKWSGYIARTPYKKLLFFSEPFCVLYYSWGAWEWLMVVLPCCYHVTPVSPSVKANPIQNRRMMDTNMSNYQRSTLWCLGNWWKVATFWYHYYF